jgi:lipopolysaccharide export system permease protein
LNKKLNILTIKYFVGPFAVTFSLSMFFFMMQFLWKYVDDMVGKGLEWYVIIKLLFYASAHLVPNALPLSVLLSAMMTFGNLAEHNELMAFKSSGVQLARVIRPLFFIVSLFAVLSFFYINYSLPKANLKFGALVFDVKAKKPAFDIKNGVFYTEIEGYSIRVGEKDKKGSGIKDVIIYDHSSGIDNNIVMKAKSGEMFVSEDQSWLKIILYDGERYQEIRDSRESHIRLPHSRLKFKEYEIRFDLSSFSFKRSNIELFKGNYRMLNLQELEMSIDSMNIEFKELKPQSQKYIQPYIYILEDSMLILSDSFELEINSNIPFLDNFEKKDRASIIKRAISSSRTVNHLLQTPSSQWEMYMKNKARYMIEWYRKIIIPLSLIILFLIGSSMGAIIRKGGLGIPTLVSVGLYIIYYLISILGEKLARKYVIEPWFGMWLPVIVLAPVALFLLFKANRDSKLFSVEAYKKPLKFIKWLTFFDRKKNNK